MAPFVGAEAISLGEHRERGSPGPAGLHVSFSLDPMRPQVGALDVIWDAPARLSRDREIVFELLARSDASTLGRVAANSDVTVTAEASDVPQPADVRRSA